MHEYQSFDEIDLALKKLKLEQQIEVEELKHTGYDLKEKFSFNDPFNLKSIGLKVIKNFSLLMFIKKLFSKR